MKEYYFRIRDKQQDPAENRENAAVLRHQPDRPGVRTQNEQDAEKDQPQQRADLELSPKGGKKAAHQGAALVPDTFDDRIIQRRRRRAERDKRQRAEQPEKACGDDVDHRGNGGDQP